MSTDPFDQYDKPSQYHKDGTSEQESIMRIQRRLERAMDARRGSKPGHLMRILTIGAAAAVILLFVLFNPFTSNSDQRLTEQYFSPYPNFLTNQVRGESAALVALREAAMQAYDVADFHEAIRLFQSFLNDATPADRFYMAQSMQATGQWHAALEVLLTLEGIQPEFEDAVRWHTALSRLSVGDTEIARSILIPLVTTQTEFATEARKLLDNF